MNALRALVKKDLLTYLHDRRAVMISFAMPAALSLFFGFAFSRRGKTADARPKVPTVVVDQDGSPAARRLVDALAADPSLTATELSFDAAHKQVGDGDVSVAIVIPAGFAARTLAVLGGQGPPGERATLRFLHDPSRPFQLAMVEGAVHAHVLAALAAGEGARELMARCAGLADPYLAHEESVAGGDEYDGAAHAVGGMAVQFILMGAIEAAVGMLTDRQRGLWRRLRAAPLARRTLIFSRILSGAIIAVAVLAFLYAFGRFTMGVRILGSPAGFALVAVSFALMASTLGVLVSTLGKTPAATRSVGMFVILVAVMLGGAWFPSFLFPEWLQGVTAFIPTRWAVDALDAMTWRGLGLQAAIAPSAALLGAAAVFAALAMWRFRWEE